MSVAIYCSYLLFLVLECMSPRWISQIHLGTLDLSDPNRSICGVTRVAVLMWLTSIPRPRPYWSDPKGSGDYQPHSAQ